MQRAGERQRVWRAGVTLAAHNGVRGDDVVEVREQKRVSNGITNSDEGGRHHVST
jgi:hypothetical protein